MTKSVVGKFGRRALWFSPVVIVVVGFFAVLWWLKPQNPVVVEVVSTVLAILVMGYSLFLGKRLQQGLDEVQVASQGFAHTHGWVWGGMAAALLLSVPPIMSWLVDLVNAVAMLSTQSPAMANQTAVRLAFFCGFALVMVMQALGVVVAAVVWWRRMGGMREQS
jgi:hypothetical protein